MRRALRSATVILVWLLPALCAAQDLAPRAYFPAPVSSNALILTYGFSNGEILFDPTLPVIDASGTIQAPVVSYYHAFNFFGRSANVTGSIPFAVGHFRGLVGGDERAIRRAGMADVVARLAVNLAGGRALALAEFAKTRPSRSVWGASVKVVAPTGEYDPTRIINIGSNRWAVKPELGYMGRAGRIVFDVYGGVWFFTANDAFAATDARPEGNTRTQDPVGAFELHVSYDVKPRLWISADVNYWRGGRTSVNGAENRTTLQANSRLGLTGSVPLTRTQSLKVSYSDGVVVRIGGSFRALSASWQYSWVGVRFLRN